MKLALKASFLLFIFFLISCKKDKKDIQPPAITFISPASAQTYKMFDTILVSARVTDNQHLSSINVTLTDLNHTPLQSSYSVPISSEGFIFNVGYILTKFQLSTGTYFMQITADDGYNTTAAYQSINITESPTKLWGYCTVLKSNLKNISYSDTSGSSFQSIALAQSYNGMHYGGYNQQLYVNGTTNQQPFQAYVMQPKSLLSYYTESDNNYAYTCLYTDGNKPYIGYKNGDIYSYNYMGSPSISYRYTPTIPAYAYYFTTTSLYGVGVFRDTTSSNSDQLVTFFGNSGAFFGKAVIALPSCSISNVVGIFEKSPDSLYVLGNDISNNAAAYLFSPAGNAFLGQINMPSGKLLSAVKVNNEYLIFSTTTGVYSCINLNYVSLLNLIAQKLSYQPKLNLLTVANGSNLNAYAVNSNTLTSIPHWSIILTDSISDFEVITNK